jgi:hypothetical protein
MRYVLPVLLATLVGGIAGWLMHAALVRPAAAATLQGQVVSGSGTVTAIAVCFGTNNPPSGWSTSAATANALANGNHRIVAVVPATGPQGCANPEIVWAQTP